MGLHCDLTDIRLFVNIAEANSLTRGAERSHMSLPAASTRIKNFEDSQGVKLLYRTSHGVTLTPAGQIFLHHGRLVLQQLHELSTDLQEYSRGAKGHIRIYANTTAITDFLPDVLSSFLAGHPDVSVDLRERASRDIIRAVSEARIDFGIVAGADNPENLDLLPYRRNRLMLATALSHPLAGRDSIHFDETLEYDYIGLSETTEIYDFLS